MNVYVYVNHPTLGEDDFSFTPDGDDSLKKQAQDIINTDYPEPGTTWYFTDEHGERN